MTAPDFTIADDAGFTPGPWDVDDEGAVRGYGRGSPYGEDLIATPLGDTAEQAEANALLIAAAPDMFEALTELEDHSMLNREENAMVSKALAKARGASQ